MTAQILSVCSEEGTEFIPKGENTARKAPAQEPRVEGQPQEGGVVEGRFLPGKESETSGMHSSHCLPGTHVPAGQVSPLPEG